MALPTAYCIKPLAHCSCIAHCMLLFVSCPPLHLTCNSASMSAGLDEWNAPLAMNSTWSVDKLPYLVGTTLPSRIGRRSCSDKNTQGQAITMPHPCLCRPCGTCRRCIAVDSPPQCHQSKAPCSSATAHAGAAAHFLPAEHLHC